MYIKNQDKHSNNFAHHCTWTPGSSWKSSPFFLTYKHSTVLNTVLVVIQLFQKRLLGKFILHKPRLWYDISSSLDKKKESEPTQAMEFISKGGLVGSFLVRRSAEIFPEESLNMLPCLLYFVIGHWYLWYLCLDCEEHWIWLHSNSHSNRLYLREKKKILSVFFCILHTLLGGLTALSPIVDSNNLDHHIFAKNLGLQGGAGWLFESNLHLILLINPCKFKNSRQIMKHILVKIGCARNAKASHTRAQRCPRASEKKSTL